MTGAQFEALAQLMRLRQSPSCEALRLVLCDGKTPKEAEVITGAPWQNTYRQHASARRVIELAKVVADMPLIDA